MPGKLFLVATPIGNLQDISLRAIDTLRTVDLIAAEDTRHTRKLLNHFSIPTKTVSLHHHNEKKRSDELIRRLAEGENIAVVSDAGTPGISDPGSLLVRRCIDQGLNVVPIPGPVAFVSAVTASGLPTDSILFAGFLPAKQGERRRRLAELAEVPATLVFYEAPHRLARSLADCLAVLGDRQACVARELTKLHEEIATGKLSELAGRFTGLVRGELVVVVDRINGKADVTLPAPTDLAERVKYLEQQGLDRKQAMKQAAKEFGVTRSEAYRRLI